MKTVKFNFKLTSKGSLANVFFYPEQEDVSILLKADSKGKEWKNESFELLVEDPFEYTLHVYGVSGTEWEAELKIIGDSEVNFLKWSGTTGDTRRNISVRTKPTKNLP
ncbi:hypothetical protein GCM10009122_22690 [Fulvivirga kasyanovii]|uniref:DUF5060 domain-containing protein n=1 Tax=Fulvivirga kasyanovii TaxID=396812 RepID=A0ABW9RRR8_9BACT|nr:hypothetical protein [Fulvivirga kasyanovii]MTI25745.1 hypothetical protein [Fulvivirga kasyanovii]